MKISLSSFWDKTSNAVIKLTDLDLSQLKSTILPVIGLKFG
jgi:hypothetical protein